MKKHVEKDRLQVLAAAAVNLQNAMSELRHVKSGNDELEAAFDGSRFALNRIIVEVLTSYLDKVNVRLNAQQPQSWDDSRAVLEVIIETVILRIPVAVLKSRAPEIASIIRSKIMDIYNRATQFVAAKAAEVDGTWHFLPQMGQDPEPDPNNPYPPEVTIGREYQVWQKGEYVGRIYIPDEGEIIVDGVCADFDKSE